MASAVSPTAPLRGRAATVRRRSKVMVLASYAPSLIRFRGNLMRALVAAGHEVVACAPEDDLAVEAQLAAIGAVYRRVPMQRAGLDPLTDLRTLAALVRLMRGQRPDVLLAYTQKPMIYGGIAARLAGVARFYAMVTGLGYAFAETRASGRRLVRRITARLFRVGLWRADGVFVFNAEDRAELRRHGIVRPAHRVVMVDGSGVDTRLFEAAPVPDGPPVFLLIARLIREKGLEEYVEAARRLRLRWPAARVQLLGPLDPNPTGITGTTLEAWRAEGAIEYLGETGDVRPYLRACSVYVLPTYYREGIPRTLLEAMAIGRPLITTDWQGCRETVAPGDNGFLVPVRDVAALEAAMARFLADPGLAGRMGARSRAMAEARFDDRRINAHLLATMGLA